ncbi:MAG: hypothetical protein V4561_12625 [Bacteroidota bacterium]
MSRIILFFLLLLSGHARAQQLLLKDAANIAWPDVQEVNSIHFTGHTVVDRHFYFSPSCSRFYCSRKVKSMNVYDSLNNKRLSIHFDSTGNFIGWHQSGYAFERHSYPKGTKLVTISELSYQSKIISKTIVKSSTKKQMRFGVPILVTRNRYISYDMGSKINHRNNSYNKAYYHNRAESNEKVQLKKRLIALYPDNKLVKCRNEMRQIVRLENEAAIAGVNAAQKEELELWMKRHSKESAKYYAEGERFSKYHTEGQNSCCQPENNQFAGAQNMAISNVNVEYTQNNQALNDSLFLLQDPAAASIETKIAPTETNVLIGRESSRQAVSDIFSKRFLYTFRYEYFGE